MKYPLLAIALLASANVFAGPGCEHGQPMERITEELKLNEAQAAQVEQILSASHKRMSEQHKAIHEDTLAQLRGVLTEEQIQTLESRWQKHGRGHGHHSGPDQTEDAGA